MRRRVAWSTASPADEQATDPETGRTEPHSVPALIPHGGPHTMVDVTTSDGHTLSATDHYPIWDATTHTFTDAIDLRVLSDDGQLLVITGLRLYQQDLQIDGIHTYYAGVTPILVYNMCAEPLPPEERSDSTADRSASQNLANYLGCRPKGADLARSASLHRR